jgi:hypothetical protein
MPDGTYFGSTDCYFNNCQESDPNRSTTTGAILNVDCISDCTGPENIWIPISNALTAGSYKVCVDPYSGEGSQLHVSVYDQSGGLIETVTRAVLNNTTGTWYVGNFNCAAGTSGKCNWSKVDTVSATAECQ